MALGALGRVFLKSPLSGRLSELHRLSAAERPLRIPPARRPAGREAALAQLQQGTGQPGPWRAGRSELATQWDFSLIGCLAEG